MDDKGNIHITYPERPDEPETVIPFDDLESQINALVESAVKTPNGCFLEITKAPREHVNKLIKAIRKKGQDAREDLVFRPDGKKYVSITPRSKV